ncbi:MAG TPA: hypothetical protein VKV95_14080 [Terriglobia bacterium]|nr:hypothetical protein [Terriglobia bacterium]
MWRISFVLCISLSSALPAAAVCLQPNPTIRAEFSHSDAVFVGTVISERALLSDGESIDGWYYSLRVEEAIRGLSSHDIAVYTGNDSGRYPLQVGRQYLLFVTNYEGRLEIYGCGNSGMLPEALGREREVERVKLESEKASTAMIEGRTFLTTGYGPTVSVVARGRNHTYSVVAGHDGWFHMKVRPGAYVIRAFFAKRKVPAFDLSWDNPGQIRVRAGQCDLVQFRADGM